LPLQTRDAIGRDTCQIQRQQGEERDDMWLLEWFGEFRIFFCPEEDLLGELEPVATVGSLKYMQRFFELIRDCSPGCGGKVMGFGLIET
jgi:hypothetical protein